MLHLNPCFLEVKSGSISKWEKNVNSPNVIQFFALCEILGIDNINDTFGIAIEENRFAQLNEEGKRKTIEYMNLLIKSGMYVREEPVYITNRTLKVKSLQNLLLPVPASFLTLISMRNLKSVMMSLQPQTSASEFPATVWNRSM